MDDETITVDFSRLMDMAMISENDQWQWDRIEPFALNEVKEKMAAGMVGESNPYGDIWKHPVKNERNRDYHICRVIYFAQHPEEINGIQVDNKCHYDGYTTAILPACEIVDGWHRIAAAILLGMKEVGIYYGGRLDIQDYLTKKTNERPTEIVSI